MPWAAGASCVAFEATQTVVQTCTPMRMFALPSSHSTPPPLSGRQEKALSVFYPRQEAAARGFTTVAYLRMQMVVAHGGRCAEHIVFGAANVTDNASDDLLKLSRVSERVRE